MKYDQRPMSSQLNVTHNIDQHLNKKLVNKSELKNTKAKLHVV